MKAIALLFTCALIAGPTLAVEALDPCESNLEQLKVAMDKQDLEGALEDQVEELKDQAEDYKDDKLLAECATTAAQALQLIEAPAAGQQQENYPNQ